MWPRLGMSRRQHLTARSAAGERVLPHCDGGAPNEETRFARYWDRPDRIPMPGAVSQPESDSICCTCPSQLHRGLIPPVRLCARRLTASVYRMVRSTEVFVVQLRRHLLP